jgi:hypothetical protein
VRHPRLVALAATASLLHAAGLTLAATAMLPGTVLVSEEARARWLAGRPLAWSVGWSVWILCALSLVALLTALNDRLRAGGSPAGNAAVALAAAGAAVDLFCDALWIGVLPDLAAQGPDRLFLAAERGLAVGGTVAANGLYACAVLVFTRLLPRGAEWGLARLLGWVTALAGFGLCGAGLHGNGQAVALFSGMTIGAFVFWAIALARSSEAAP